MKLTRVIPFFLTLALAPALGVAACDSPTRPAFSRDGFSVSVEGGELVLRNQSAGVIHFVVLEAETATRTDLEPRTELWAALAVGFQARIPLDELNGYTPAASQARVFWATTSGLQPSFLVDLR